MSSILVPSQILELNVISAQDLAPVARCMKTYAVAWLHPDRKLTTRVDNTGGTSPTWNDKFVFRIDDESLYDGTSLVVIEIYALHWFKDIHVGTVQALIADLVSPSSSTMRFITLEVLRASGRPQGLLNIAVGIIDSSMRSMPLYNNNTKKKKNTPSLFDEDDDVVLPPLPKKLQRSKSDTSSMVESELSGLMKANNNKRFGNMNGKLESQTTADVESDKNMEYSSDSQMVTHHHKPNFPEDYYGFVKASPYKVVPKHLIYGTPMRPKHLDSNNAPKKNKVEYGTPMRSRPVVITESELGPSASVVAAQVAKERALAGKDAESTIISVDERSVEGLQSKLERWQADLPPVLDVTDSGYQPNSTYKPNRNYNTVSFYKPNEAPPPHHHHHVKYPHQMVTGGGGGLVKKHSRRHTDGGGSGGLFSCFSNICGIECSIVCGSSSGPKGSQKKKK